MMSPPLVRARLRSSTRRSRPSVAASAAAALLVSYTRRLRHRAPQRGRSTVRLWRHSWCTRSGGETGRRCSRWCRSARRYAAPHRLTPAFLHRCGLQRSRAGRRGGNPSQCSCGEISFENPPDSTSLHSPDAALADSRKMAGSGGSVQQRGARPHTKAPC